MYDLSFSSALVQIIMDALLVASNYLGDENINCCTRKQN